MDIVELGRLGDRSNDWTLLDGIARFARHLEGRPGDDLTLHTHVAVFDGPRDTDEARFEALLWAQLQRLHDLDLARGSRWAGDVSSDPDDPRFSLSLGGHPFFVIGLHPGASRRARRFAWPAMVFNSHRQFDRLRRNGPADALGGLPFLLQLVAQQFDQIAGDFLAQALLGKQGNPPVLGLDTVGQDRQEALHDLRALVKQRHQDILGDEDHLGVGDRLYGHRVVLLASEDQVLAEDVPVAQQFDRGKVA